MGDIHTERTTESDRTFDEYWTALDHPERRECLLTLLGRDRPVEMATAVDGGGGIETERRRALHDEHLPILADLDLIEWDSRTRRVDQGPAFETVEPLLHYLDENDQPTSGEVA